VAEAGVLAAALQPAAAPLPDRHGAELVDRDEPFSAAMSRRY
jgi:hypothetical protein